MHYNEDTQALSFFFSSPLEFQQALPALPKDPSNSSGGGQGESSERLNWRGGLEYSKARECLTHGHESMRLDDADLPPLWDTEMNSVGLAPVGFTPCVPAAIAGDPASMYALEPMQGQGPIRLFVGVNSRSDIDAGTIKKRGVALLRLVRSLALLRPVTLYAYCDHYAEYKNKKVTGGSTAGAVFPIVQLDPMDTQSTVFCLSHASFLRQLCFEFNSHYGFDGSYGWGAITPFDRGYTTKRRETLGLESQDLLIPGGLPPDLLLSDPVAWFEQETKKQSACTN